VEGPDCSSGKLNSVSVFLQGIVIPNNLIVVWRSPHITLAELVLLSVTRHKIFAAARTQLVSRGPSSAIGEWASNLFPAKDSMHQLLVVFLQKLWMLKARKT
jgi:hypothetical protein